MIARPWLPSIAACVFAMAAAEARAGGPPAVATIDRALWPESIGSRPAFDRASRAEILVFVHELELALEHSQEPANGLRRWLDQIRPLVLENYRHARKSCVAPSELGCDDAPSSYEDLTRRARAFVLHPPTALAVWLLAARDFHRTYVAEQVRLASLFPKTTSEILTFGDGEQNGADFADLQFLLTFDDGPTDAGQNTDRTVAALRAAGGTGVFFALGARLQARRKADGDEALRALYAGQCLASHGWKHGSHAKIPDWETSITSTRELVREVARLAPTAPVPFRPPYGQRTPAIAAWAKTARSPIVLWNIDSQDWNPHMTAAAVADRIVTLMALWRHGILLFHDSHASAAYAVPKLVRTARFAKLDLRDCKSFRP